MDNIEKALNEIRAALKRGEAIEVRPLPNEPQAFEMDLFRAWRTLLTYWKKIVAITLFFTVIGVIGGAIYYSTPKPSPKLLFDQYIGVEINIEDPYDEIFSNADQYHNEMITYIDALQNYMVSKEYGDKDADKEYLTNLKKNINKSYAKTFLIAKKLNQLYCPVRDEDIEERLITLELKQKELSIEMQCLQQELAYLTNIAAVGERTVGGETDSAIAQGVNKARNLAFYRQEYEDNVKLINELSGVADNSERVQHLVRIEKLLDEGISANQQFENELNQFAKNYFKKHNVSIVVSEIPDETNSDTLNYTVTVEEAKQQPSPLRIPKAITLLLTCIGFGLACIWVLWKHYKLDSNNHSEMNGS